LGPYDLAGRTVRAARGIAAGSAHATAELKLYLLPVILALQHKTLSDEGLVTSLSIFVDDISFSVSSPAEGTTLDAAVTVFRDMRDALAQVDLPIAADKIEAIASTDGLHGAFASIIVIANSAANHCKKARSRLLPSATAALLGHPQGRESHRAHKGPSRCAALAAACP
jgi:hypothetical protein